MIKPGSEEGNCQTVQPSLIICYLLKGDEKMDKEGQTEGEKKGAQGTPTGKAEGRTSHSVHHAPQRDGN